MRPRGLIAALLLFGVAAPALLAVSGRVPAQDTGDASISVPLTPGDTDREVVITFRNPTGMDVSDIDVKIVGMPDWAAAARLSATRIGQLAAGADGEVRVRFDVAEDANGNDPILLRFTYTDDATELDTHSLAVRPRFAAAPEVPDDEKEEEPTRDPSGAVMRLVEIRGPADRDGEAISVRFDGIRAGYLERRVRDFRGQITETITSLGFTDLPLDFTLGQSFGFTAERRVQINQDPAACDERGDSGVAGWGAGDVALALRMAFGTLTRFDAKLQREHPIPCQDSGSGGLGMHDGYRVGGTLTLDVRCHPVDAGAARTTAADDTPRFAYRCAAESDGDTEETVPGIRLSSRGSMMVELNGISLFYRADGDSGAFTPYSHPFEVVQVIGGESDESAQPILGLAAVEVDGRQDASGTGIAREERRTAPRDRTNRESTGFTAFPAFIRLGEAFDYAVSLRAESVIRERYCVGNERLETPADTYIGRGDMAMSQMNHARYVAADMIDFRCDDSGRLLDEVQLSAEGEVRVSCEPTGKAEARDDGGRTWRYRCRYDGGPIAAGGRNAELEFHWLGEQSQEPAAQVVLVNGFGVVSSPQQRRQVVLRYAPTGAIEAGAYSHPFPRQPRWRHPDEAIAEEPPEMVADPAPAVPRPETQAPDPDSPDVTALIAEWIISAEPPDNARNGDRFRYETWGRVVGTSADGGIITVNAAPDDAGARGPYRYLWERRDRLDSVDHCTLGEFIELRLAAESIDRCRGRYGPEAPDLAGATRAEALKHLEARQLVPLLRPGDPAPTADLDGRVQRQSVEPGSRLERGDSLTLWLHTQHRAGSPLPDVTGLELAQAREILEAAGLNPVVRIGEAAPGPARTGRIVRQRPVAGAMVEPDADIELTVYGPPLISVPDVVGLEAERAVARIKASGLVAVTASAGVAPRTAAAGSIAAQDPPATTKLAAGATVTLNVWQPPPRPVPQKVQPAPAPPPVPAPTPAPAVRNIPVMTGVWEGSGDVELRYEGKSQSLPFTLAFRIAADGASTGAIEASGQRLDLAGAARGGALRLAGEQVSRDDDGTVSRVEVLIEGKPDGSGLSGTSTYRLPDPACVVEALAEGIAEGIAPFGEDEEEQESTCATVDLRGTWSAQRLP